MQQIQNSCVKEARRLGYMAIKMPTSHQVGLPDYMFIGYQHIFFVEFKRPGEPLRAAQRRVLRNMAEMKQECYVIDNVDDFFRIPKKVVPYRVES